MLTHRITLLAILAAFALVSASAALACGGCGACGQAACGTAKVATSSGVPACCGHATATKLTQARGVEHKPAFVDLSSDTWAQEIIRDRIATRNARVENWRVHAWDWDPYPHD